MLQDSVADLSNLYSNTVEENKKLEKALENYRREKMVRERGMVVEVVNMERKC
ncbi:MAG: hypothetical protein J1F07_07270 [Muribaculaceae bacterium]|nr:hypothetical protein [Muribaculaceae bacterium]